MPAEDPEPTVSSPPAAAQTKESPLTDIATSPPLFNLPNDSVIDRSNEDSSELSDLGDEDSEAETDKMDFLDDESNPGGLDNPLDLHALSKLTELAKLQEVDDDFDDDNETKKRSREYDGDQELEEAKKLKFETSEDLIKHEQDDLVVDGQAEQADQDRREGEEGQGVKSNRLDQSDREGEGDDFQSIKNNDDDDADDTDAEIHDNNEDHQSPFDGGSDTRDIKDVVHPPESGSHEAESGDNESESVGLESTGKLSEDIAVGVPKSLKASKPSKSSKTPKNTKPSTKSRANSGKTDIEKDSISSEHSNDNKDEEEDDDDESRNNSAQSIASDQKSRVTNDDGKEQEEEDVAAPVDAEEDDEEEDDVAEDGDEEESSTKTRAAIEQDDFDLNEKRKVAIKELIDVEEEFAQLRDKLYQDKLDLLEHELQLCLEGSHPELSKIYYKVNGFYQENIKYANSNLRYRLRCIDKQTLACRTGIHQDFLKNMMDSKNEMIAETTSLWYKINKERNSMDQLVPDFNYRAVPTIKDSRVKAGSNVGSNGDGAVVEFEEEPVAPLPAKVVKQKTIYELVKQRNNFNQELGINRALLEFHGFPSSIGTHFMDDSLSPVEELLLRKASDEQINDDLKAMGIIT